MKNKKKINLFVGIQKLLSLKQWSSLHEYQSKKLKGNTEELEKSTEELKISKKGLKISKKELEKNTEGLKKGPKVRGKNIINQAKANKQIILEEAKRLKKETPHIKRKRLAYELEEFAKNFKKNKLSKKYSYSYIYRTILKKNS